MTLAEQYQQERQRLELNRSLDWSSYTKDYVVAGETLLPMKVQTWFDLLAIKSPLLFSNEPTVASLVDYVWKNSKRHTHNRWLREWRIFWIQRNIIKSILDSKQGPALIMVLTEHLKSSLDEFPLDQSAATSKKVNTMPSVSGEASMIDEIASRYSMTPDEVLQMPVRRAFSLQRIIRITNTPGYKLLEPDCLREIKTKYLNSLNHGT